MSRAFRDMGTRLDVLEDKITEWIAEKKKFTSLPY